MKHIYFLLLFFTISICASASVNADSYKCLFLWHQNGTKTVVALYKEPRLLFDGETMRIQSPVLELSFPKKDILKYTFGKEEVGTSVESILKENDNVYIDGQKVIISGKISISAVALYDLSGRKIPVAVQKTGNGLQISLTSLPQNIYILKAGDKSIKFSKL